MHKTTWSLITSTKAIASIARGVDHRRELREVYDTLYEYGVSVSKLDGPGDPPSIDLLKTLRGIGYLVEDLFGLNVEAAEEIWRPSAHQEAVLSTLRREGRMKTGALWARLQPTHIQRRAHQHQMNELVERHEVETAGKGKAIEFWVRGSRS